MNMREPTENTASSSQQSPEDGRRSFDAARFLRPALFVLGGGSLICLFFASSMALGSFSRMYQGKATHVVRMRANLEPMPISAVPPTVISTRFSGAVNPKTIEGLRPSFVRGKIQSEVITLPQQSAVLPRAYGAIAFTEGGVHVQTADGNFFIQRLQKTSNSILTSQAEPFALDFFAPEDAKAAPALHYGEQLDAQGAPVRWSTSVDDITGKTLTACALQKRPSNSLQHFIYRLNGPFKGTDPATRARYQEFAEQYARQYKLTTGLVLAIMRAESNFNPGAVSPQNAMGLMQVVQSSAGVEAHKFLTGNANEPSNEILFDPERNIKYGTTYLHLLTKRYFNDIANEASREICVIAAYNGGPNAVLRVFDRDKDAAIAAINTLTPEELYETLTAELPTAESRRYLEVVLGHLRSYSF